MNSRVSGQCSYTIYVSLTTRLRLILASFLYSASEFTKSDRMGNACTKWFCILLFGIEK